jgi:anaerobic ribonucleoside-triphosphate reductase activating protein
MIMSPREIVNRILLDDITGFTFSGGEPMEQAGGFAEVAHIARHERDINIICFTGYRYEHLLKDPPNSDVAGLLAQVDVLIDGPYVQALNDSIGLRGSANQRIIHLSSRLRDHDLESFKRSIEIRITNGELAFVGIPTPGMTSAMEGIL